MKRVTRGPAIWIALGVMLVWLAASLLMTPNIGKIETSQGMELLKGDTVVHAEMVEGQQQVVLELSEPFENATQVSFQYTTPQGPAVAEAIASAELKEGYNAKVPQVSWVTSMMSLLLPMLIFGGLLFFLLTRMQGGGGRVMSFGKSRAKLVSKESPKVTFADVAGVDEALEELGEIRDFLANPARFQAVGAKIPKGVLLYGQPGTGKTLLARAVAGEAGVPFYTISGSDFVEMFVGVGASRVRDLFEQAKQNAPSIIFIDEIDAVGRQRGAGLGGGHDEREQTLNQMLVEMDGFDVNTNVILIAATNRPDILDPALLRPGRFDRQITVDPPDLRGREQILRVHAKGKPMSRDVDLAAVAKRTPGFTGADLANVLNEAALLTARTNRQFIDNLALDEAIDRVIAGPQKSSRLMNEHEKKITAYHEGGHAMVAWALRYTDPVTKVTILPRGRALGYTMVLPTEDRYSKTRNELMDQLAYALGGRVAEEVVFHDPTTGAANDIEKATAIARKMVTEYGMSARVGAVKLGTGTGGDVFLGRDYGHTRDYSEAMAGTIDHEVRALIEFAHDEAYEIINQYRDVLDALVLELLERETLNQADLAVVFANVQKREPRQVWLSADDRTPSAIPPVRTPREIEAGAPAEPPQDQAVISEEQPANPIGQVPDGGTVQP